MMCQKDTPVESLSLGVETSTGNRTSYNVSLLSLSLSLSLCVETSTGNHTSYNVALLSLSLSLSLSRC